MTPIPITIDDIPVEFHETDIRDPQGTHNVLWASASGWIACLERIHTDAGPLRIEGRVDLANGRCYDWGGHKHGNGYPEREITDWPELCDAFRAAHLQACGWAGFRKGRESIPPSFLR